MKKRLGFLVVHLYKAACFSVVFKNLARNQLKFSKNSIFFSKNYANDTLNSEVTIRQSKKK